MKKCFRIIFLIISICVFASSYIYAQTQTPAGFTTYHISFPIVELGNCATPIACKAFCDDPNNHAICIDFAKKKGFYKGDDYRKKRAIALSSAQAELNCNSLEQCQQLCNKLDNFDKCSTFAQKFGLKGGVIKNPESSIIIEKAQSVLGCKSYESCKTFCSQESNREKCTTFAKSSGLEGGIVKEGPGKCANPQSCGAYCSDPNNFTECVSFAKTHSLVPSGTPIFTGPGGCGSEAACREYCQKKPHECNNFSETNRQKGNQKTLLPETTSTNSPVYYPTGVSSTVNNFQKTVVNPETYCKQTSGCSWTGKTCLCSSAGIPNQIPGSQQSVITIPPSQSINCTGPDGKHFQATQQDCINFNKAWENTVSPTLTSGQQGGYGSGTSGGQVDYSSLGAGTPQISCTGPDGKQFQATQAQCDYFNNQWKSNQQSQTQQNQGSSGVSSSPQNQPPTTQSHGSYSQCSSLQDCCSKCGGTWTGSTCNNPTSCH